MDKNWAVKRADEMLRSIGFVGITDTGTDETAETVRDTIAAALQEVADECANIADWAAFPVIEIRAKGHPFMAVIFAIPACLLVVMAIGVWR